MDGQCYAAMDAAAGLDVPALALRIDSAATFRAMLAYPRLRDAGYVPIREEMLDEPVPGLEPLRVRDLIRVDGSDAAALCGFIARTAGAIRAAASGVVVNTFEGIEAAEVEGPRRGGFLGQVCQEAVALHGPRQLGHGVEGAEEGRRNKGKRGGEALGRRAGGAVESAGRRGGVGAAASEPVESEPVERMEMDGYSPTGQMNRGIV